MGASEGRWRAALAAALALATVAGCATGGSSSGASSIPPQAVVPPASAEDPTAAPAPAAAAAGQPAAPAAAPAATGDPTLVVIDAAPAAADPSTTSLAAVAAQERARRKNEGTPALVINNKNLSAYAAGGVLTIAQGEAPKADDAAAKGAPAAADGQATSEAYWRQRGLEIRKRWRDAYDRIPELENKAAELRQRFYSVDDPVVRDGQIKPEWDRALADLEEAKYRVARGAEEVANFLEEGRRAGALPGWLREGADLEPEPVLETTDGGDLSISEPQEPPVYDQPPVEPPPVLRRRA